VGAAGTVASSGSSDAFVLALNTANGTPLNGFGAGGVQKFGGAGNDFGQAIAVSGTTIFVAGYFDGSNAGVGGTGSVASAGFSDAFVLALNSVTGAAASGFGSGGVQTFGGSSSDYGQGVAIAGTTLYAAGNFNSTNAGVGGLGGYTTAGGFNGFLVAMDIVTAASLPRITSPLTLLGAAGAPFNYTITGTYSPTSFNAVNLPGGLTFNPVTGVISGTYPAGGAYTVALAAINGYGAGVANLSITSVGDAVAVNYPPVISGRVRALAIDASGNRYVAGYYQGTQTQDFNSGVGVDIKSSVAGGLDAL